MMYFFNCPFCLETKRTKKFKKIYIEPSHGPLPDTNIFSCQRTLFLRNNSIFLGICLPISGELAIPDTWAGDAVNQKTFRSMGQV